MSWDKVAGELIRDRRTEAGLTQRALAELTGIPQPRIARIEAHREQPTVPVLCRLMDAFGAEVGAIDVSRIDEKVAVRVAEEIQDLLGGPPTAERIEECFRSVATIVDEAQRTPRGEFRRRVAVGPPPTGKAEFDALIAAVVEDCCNRLGVKAPSWVDDDWRSVDEWYPAEIPSLREAAQRESPPAFRRHGVFVVDGELSRA